ncbi:hypothetical protein Anapl_03971 [Anas platyrhynchos]|uniref:Uncharacterized protein n=1 Tax=Anas platyrhynchos TaxID=8839 RepID=R0LT59_ANAPL|nr:hypothetical protein Anapl_03971 [Anas platyrhynchos]
MPQDVQCPVLYLPQLLPLGAGTQPAAPQGLGPGAWTALSPAGSVLAAGIRKWLLLPKQARVFVKRSGCKVLLLSHDLLVCSFMNAVFMCCLPSASDLDMCDLHGQQKGAIMVLLINKSESQSRRDPMHVCGRCSSFGSGSSSEFEGLKLPHRGAGGLEHLCTNALRAPVPQDYLLSVAYFPEELKHRFSSNNVRLNGTLYSSSYVVSTDLPEHEQGAFSHGKFVVSHM